MFHPGLRFGMGKMLLVGAWWFASASVCLPAGAERVNPYEGDDAAQRAGRALYAGRCADCHGADAKGNRGPDLTLRFAAGAGDESLFTIIRQGVPGSIMPPSGAPENELWAIVAYLRSISTVLALVSTGDVARGRALFAHECEHCHRVGSVGGALGPDLTRVGQTRSREALVAALREPGASVALGFRAVTLVTRRGATVAGVVKAEDAFSIQIMTIDGQLRGYRKSDLASVDSGTESAMPQFSPARLDEAALEDLLAYLGTLRGAEAAAAQ